MTKDSASLAARGLKLWDDMTSAHKLDPMQLELLLEGCRIADRLETMNEMLAGGPEVWAEVESAHGTMTLVIDKAMTEARLNAAALKMITTELRQAARVESSQDDNVVNGGDNVSDLRSRIAARRAQSED